MLLYDLNKNFYEHFVSVRLVLLQNNYDSAIAEIFVALIGVVLS